MGLNIPTNSMVDIAAPFPKPLISNDRPGCASCSDYACFLSEDKSTALIFYKYTAWDMNAFEILKVKENNLPKHCVKTSINPNKIITESGIKIGSTKEFVSKSLGVNDAEGEIMFQYQNKLNQEQIAAQLQWSMSTRPPKCEHFYSDAATVVTAEYDENGLIRFKISFMEML
ncbi:hypothetical protein NBRC116188_19970 [Oceaniserpentilla sp. 4NH20-0058]